MSPYVEAAAKRAALIPKAFIEHDRRQYEFSRGITDGIKVQPSPPMETIWERAAGVALIGASGAAALVVIYNIARVMGWL